LEKFIDFIFLIFQGSATGEIDNFKLSQLGIFLVTSLRATDIRRITTDALINKIHFFKSTCFQPAKAEAQALGARLNDALGEVDDALKALYLDLIGELAAYLPNDIAAPKVGFSLSEFDVQILLYFSEYYLNEPIISLNHLINFKLVMKDVKYPIQMDF
jgi:hypothetical protein